MDKYCEKILKYLNKFSTDDKPVSNIYFYHNFNLDLKTIDASLNFLHSNNYICKYFSHKTGIISYYSTSKGKDYFKDKFKTHLKNNLFNIFKVIFLDILCPLLVAYLTARITINNAITNNECCNKSSQTADK